MKDERYAAWLIETCAKPPGERDTLLDLEGPWDLRQGVIGLAAELAAAEAQNADLISVLEHSATHKALASMAAENGRLAGELGAAKSALSAEQVARGQCLIDYQEVKRQNARLVALLERWLLDQEGCTADTRALLVEIKKELTP